MIVIKILNEYLHNILKKNYWRKLSNFKGCFFTENAIRYTLRDIQLTEQNL